jgi:cell division protein DivIC
MKLLSGIPSFLRNKYFVAATMFAVWVLFFDRNDFFAQRERQAELHTLQQSKSWYLQQIKEERRFAEDLKSNPATIEKFAREKYGMKRDNEDLFLIQTPSSTEKP